MIITTEILERNREALERERDGYLEESDRLRSQATGVQGAIRMLAHLIELVQKPEEIHE